MATIMDVARQAGVSVTAVSRALNNYPDINSDTKARILKVVKELRYYPKASARNLVTSKSHAIGVFYPSFDGLGLRQPFIGHILTVIHSELGRHGYDLLIFGVVQAQFGEFTMLDSVRYRDVDGVILLGLPDKSINQVIEEGIPLVGIDFVTPGVRTGSVTSENRQAIQNAVQTLYQSGYRTFGFVHAPLQMPVAMERLQGFYEGLTAVGLSPNQDWIISSGYSLQSGLEAGQEFLSKQKLPEVVICSADTNAIGILQTFQRAGLRVPDDIGIVGFDDIDAASYVYPSLTTIRQNADAMGKKASEIMLKLIEDPYRRDMPLNYVLGTELIARESTRPIRRDR